MSNSLIYEKSPYLLEHADNPVHWYPWGEEAFTKAKREDKPIFLSIGYSTCHWCHVMAEESFADPELARRLNDNYISIKVDREERPDVDAVYMAVCTVLTGSGGWPLTIIMTPQQKPFFAATYLPRDSSRSRMGLLDVLEVLASKWKSDRVSLLKSSEDISRLVSRSAPSRSTQPDGDYLHSAFAQLFAAYDGEFGGFGQAPKFPAPQNLLFLLRYAALSGERQAREMAEGCLRGMYRGGIYDHFGGGFSRYSTDREWLAPHFEKTLYDNALLAYVYAEAYQSGHMALYRSVAENTLDYCMRELLSPEGGYCCGQDADSGGVEGAYYLYTPQEVEQVLGSQDGRHFAQCYDILPEGNFHGKSIPNLILNQRWNLLPGGYEDFRERMRMARAERMPLKTDSKMLTAWNGLMLTALAKAAAVFRDRRYLCAARELADFLAHSMVQDGQLMARRCDGELKYPAQLDDYVYYALGLLDLYRADYDPAHILRAQELAQIVIRDFADGRGAYYRTAAQGERLLFRPREIFDGAMPSGNSGAAVLFDTLFRLTGDVGMRQKRDALLCCIGGENHKYPAGSPFALCAALSDVFPTRELLCAAPDEQSPELLQAVTARYSPELTVLLKSPKRAALLAQCAPFTVHADPKEEKAAFYVCENGACREGLSL